MYGCKSTVIKAKAFLLCLQTLEVIYLIYMGRYFCPALILFLFVAAATLLIISANVRRCEP